MKDENPSAFPLHPGISPDLPDSRWLGMSLRDWFAGQALAGMQTWVPSPPEGWPMGAQDERYIQRLKAEWAYGMADAMISARKREGAEG